MCGCKIAFQEGLNIHQRIEGLRIEFCPVHAAAEEMEVKLKAAEKIIRNLMDLQDWFDSQFLEDVRGISTFKLAVKAALSAWEKAGKGA